MYLHRYMHRHEDFLQDLNQVVEFRFAAVRFDESHIGEFGGSIFQYTFLSTEMILLMEEILHHLGCIKLYEY